MLTGIKNRNTMNNRIDRIVAGEDILRSMRLADEEMYKDKKRYYASNPELKYR